MYGFQKRPDRAKHQQPASAANQPLQITNGFEQPAKPGGLQITNGFEPANPAPGALQITNGFDTPATPQPTGAGVQSAASALGVPPGPAAQMARGFPGFANGGMVRGPGTGTSDSVKDAVPPGTYIMPADSTQQIGAQNLAGLGFRPEMRAAMKAAAPRLGFKSRAQREREGIESPPEPRLGFRPRGNVPVNLSDGEYKIPPEQVQAVGAQVLDAMKGRTHTPTELAEEAGEDKPASDSLYFADGGMVPDEKKRDPFAYQPPGSAPATPRPSPIPGAERSNLPTFKPDASAPSPIKGPLDSMGATYGETAKKLTFGAFDSSADAIRARNREGLIAEPEKPSATATAAAMPGQTLTTDPGLSAIPATATAPAAPAPATNNITRTGNSYSGTDIGQGFTINGQAPRTGGHVAPADGQDAARGFRPGMGAPADAPPAAPEPGAGLGFRPGMGNSSPDVMGILQRESKIRGEMTGLRDQIAFNEGGSGFRKTTNDEIVRDMLVNGGAGDRSAALGFMAGRQDAGARQDMSQQELALRQQDAQSRQGIAAGEFGLKQEAQGFQSTAQRRLQGLQDQFMAEQDPAKRSQIAQTIRDISGKEPPKQDFEMAKARMNLISDLSKQYNELRPTDANKKPIPFDVWAQPILRTARMGQFVDQPQATFEEGKVYIDAKGNKATFKNGKWVPV